jgi:hypothetical protein
MTIREIGGIRGIRRPMESVGTARVSRNVDLIATGGGIGRRCAVTLEPTLYWTLLFFFVRLCDSTIVISAQRVPVPDQFFQLYAVLQWNESIRGQRSTPRNKTTKKFASPGWVSRKSRRGLIRVSR